MRSTAVHVARARSGAKDGDRREGGRHRSRGMAGMLDSTDADVLASPISDGPLAETAR